MAENFSFSAFTISEFSAPTNPRHPGLNPHEFTSLSGANGEKVFEAYAQNQTPEAYRIFWHYGPDEGTGKKRIAVMTIVAITPHP